MKKKLAVIGTAMIAAAVITACGGKDTQPAATAAETTTETTTEAATQPPTTTEAATLTDAKKTDGSTGEQDEEINGEATSLQADESGDVSHAGAELEAGEIKPFAEKVQKAVADKDMTALADLCAFPLYVSLGEGEGREIADRDSFMKLDADKLFTEGMSAEIADTDVNTLEQFGAGVIMGNENNVIFNNVDGQAAVTGIILQ